MWLEWRGHGSRLCVEVRERSVEGPAAGREQRPRLEHLAHRAQPGGPQLRYQGGTVSTSSGCSPEDGGAVAEAMLFPREPRTPRRGAGQPFLPTAPSPGRARVAEGSAEGLARSRCSTAPAATLECVSLPGGRS